MITAKEAMKKSDEANEERARKAKIWALNELDYIENQILKAIEDGKYETDYWWSKSCLKEAGITQSEARVALREILSDLGYHTGYHFNYGLEQVFMVVINWEEKDE